MSAPIAAATLQAALLGAISNILAQAITAYRKDVLSDWSGMRELRVLIRIM